MMWIDTASVLQEGPARCQISLAASTFLSNASKLTVRCFKKFVSFLGLVSRHAGIACGENALKNRVRILSNLSASILKVLAALADLLNSMHDEAGAERTSSVALNM